MAIFDNIGNFMKGGDVSVQQVGEVASNMLEVVKWVVIFGFIVLLCIVFYKFYIQYNIKVRLKFRRAGKIVKVKDDKAREIVDQHGKRKLLLFGMRKATPIPEQKYKYYMGRKDYYEFIVDDNNELHPLDTNVEDLDEYETVRRGDILTEPEYKQKDKELYGIMSEEMKGKTRQEKKEIKEKYKQMILDWCDELVQRPTLRASMTLVPQERIGWILQENKILEEKLRSKSKMEKYLPLIRDIVGYVTIFLLFYFGMKHLAGIAGGVGDGLRLVAQNCLGR